MGNVTGALRAFIDDEIRLSRKNVTDAVRSRNWFLSRLSAEIGNRVDEPSLLPGTPFFFFGSYFKGTKVSDLDEFDVLVVMDTNNGQFSRGGTVVGTGIGSAGSNRRYDPQYLKNDGFAVSPAKTLNWLKGIAEAVVAPYGGQAPERNGQAVTVQITSQNLKIDLVPAGIFHSVVGGVFYDIPKGDVSNGWIVTAPQIDIDQLETAAWRQDLKNIIRLCKYIRTSHNFLVPSFAIETCIVQSCPNRLWYNDLCTDLKETLSVLVTAFRNGIILDPCDNQTNLISDITGLAWYAERLSSIMSVLASLETQPDGPQIKERVYGVLKNA